MFKAPLLGQKDEAISETQYFFAPIAALKRWATQS
jgi:hypothetical protein